MRVPLLSTFSSTGVVSRVFDGGTSYHVGRSGELQGFRPLYAIVVDEHNGLLVRNDLSLIPRMAVMSAVLKLPKINEHTFTMKTLFTRKLVPNTVWAMIVVRGVSVRDFVRANRKRFVPVLVGRDTVFFPLLEPASATSAVWTVFGDDDTWERRILNGEYHDNR